MRRSFAPAPAVAALVALALAPAAPASPPSLSLAADAPKGLAPLTVTLTARTDAPLVRWELGDGSAAEGPVVRHAFAAAGTYRVAAVAVGPTGEETRAELQVTAYRLTFQAPRRGTYGTRGRFTGSIWPAVARARVEVLGPRSAVVRGRTGAGGGFALRGRLLSRGPFRVRVAGLVSGEDSTVLTPRVEARVVGSGIVGERLRLVARLRPSGSGRLVVRVTRGRRVVVTGTYGGAATVRLPSGRATVLGVRVGVVTADGYARPRTLALTAVVARPQLRLGSRGPSVVALERRLQELRYALPRTDAVYGLDTTQAVLAFQSVERLPRTGRVDVRTWRRLVTARTPMPRSRGTHIEVSKGGQYLMAVRGDAVVAIVHVSTGATGNTPIGRWRIYRKSPGWDWVLWYPMYFLRGFAVHGYPDVPSFPASHGCVRVPMWIAPRLYTQFTYGQTVEIYW
ncbi:MAG TPA: L,D-transpeptidase family protein [Gaiellaceae bacterium]|nr:L,D-transpeptidase family protein [Gaiellaceae bacterium]